MYRWGSLVEVREFSQILEIRLRGCQASIFKQQEPLPTEPSCQLHRKCYRSKFKNWKTIFETGLVG